MLNLNATDIAALRSYLERANNGSGRLVGVTAKLYRAGFLSLTWTSRRNWILTLTAKGRQVLAAAKESL